MLPKRDRETRSGRFVPQGDSYAVFIPKPLPPSQPIELEADLLSLLEQAGTELGRLDGIARVIPDPDFFVSMYVRREAVLSSQIEGTRSTLEDLLEREIGAGADDQRTDVLDIVNYVQAMNFGLERLETLPLSLRLIRDIHRELLKEGRGSPATPASSERRRTGSVPTVPASSRRPSSRRRSRRWRRHWPIWRPSSTRKVSTRR